MRWTRAGRGVEGRVAAVLGATAGVLAVAGTTLGQFQFQAPIERSVPAAPVGLAAADLDGANGPDLAVIDAGGRLHLLYNSGSGGIASQEEVTLFGGAGQVAASGIFAAEVTDAGGIDLLVADQAGPVIIVANDGFGYEENTNDFVAFGSKQALLARFNAGGRKVIVGLQSAADRIASRVGDGSGGYQGVDTQHASGDMPCAMAVGSVDSLTDAHLDLLVANTGAASVDVLRYVRDIPLDPDSGSPGGIETTLTQRVSVGQTPEDIAVADLNADGFLDFAVVTGGLSRLEVYFGAGNGLFSAGPVMPASDVVTSLTIGDFNGDGAPEIAVATFHSIVVATVTPSSVTPALTISAPIGIDDILTVDFDGDGVDDLAGVSEPSAIVQVYLAAPSACAADLDGGGDVDVFDLLIYLDLWFVTAEGAERTGDVPASIDVFDLLSYLDEWFAGCP